MANPRLLVAEADEHLAAQVERAVAGLRPRPEVLRCDGVPSIAALVDEQGPVDMIIAGPSLAGSECLEQLRRLRARMPAASLVLAFNELPRNVRATVRTGAVDVLRLPAKDEVILEAVEQALEVTGARLHRPGSSTAGMPDGLTVALVSASGGAGKTFLASNFAYYLQTRSQGRTCLLDLDLQFGELSTALDLKPRFTLANLVASEDFEAGLTPSALEKYVAVHDTGVRVLAGPREPEEGEGIDGADVAVVLDAARKAYDHVVVDTPSTLSEATLVALDRADLILVVATLDLPSLRNLGVLLSTLRALKVPEERIRLVLNKIEPDAGIDVGVLDQYFPQGFSLRIPYAREVTRALNQGMPVLAHAPRTEVGKTLARDLPGILPAAAGGAEEAPKPSRWHSRRRRAA